MYIKKLKELIASLSTVAVEFIEEKFSTQEGQIKKAAAISFVLAALPIPTFFKPFAKIIFAKILDISIETAVLKMKELNQNA